MKIKRIMDNDKYLKKYIKIYKTTYGSKVDDMNKYIEKKLEKIKNEDKVLSILGLIDNDNLVGFISLFKYDGDNFKNLTPWYATLYIDNEYRGKGYSKLLTYALEEEAKNLGYDKLYLKTDLKNYYEKYGAICMGDYDDKDKLYYIDL